MAGPLNNDQWIYAQRPVGRVGAEHYELRQSQLDQDLAANEVLVAVRYISVDPYMRIQQAVVASAAQRGAQVDL